MDISTFDLTSIVTIVLGTTGTEIMIHKQVLCTHCAFAEVCLQGGFKEVEEGKILLKEEEEEESVRTLIAWMYHGKAMLPTLPIRDQPNAKEALQNLALKMTKLYIMADKYLMTKFKNEIMLFWTELCRRSNQTSFVLPALELLLKRSPPKCELKQLLVDRLVQNVKREQARGSKSFFIEHPHSPYNKEFFALIFNHTELASIILQRMLQPEIQTMPETQIRPKKRHLDGGESPTSMSRRPSISIKRRRTSSP